MSTIQRESKRSIVPLVEGECDHVQVRRLDDDVFMLTAQQAIDLLSVGANAVAFQAQLEDLLDQLYGWVEERKSKIAKAYISIASDGICLVVVQSEVAFDFDFEDELVELDIAVANNQGTNLIPFNTLLVPRVGDSVLKTFLSSGTILPHSDNADQGKPSRHGD